MTRGFPHPYYWRKFRQSYIKGAFELTYEPFKQHLEEEISSQYEWKPFKIPLSDKKVRLDITEKKKSLEKKKILVKGTNEFRDFQPGEYVRHTKHGTTGKILRICTKKDRSGIVKLCKRKDIGKIESWFYVDWLSKVKKNPYFLQGGKKKLEKIEFKY